MLDLDDVKNWTEKEWAECMEEAEAILREVNADPSIKDVKMPEGTFEKLMEKIRKKEQSKQ